MQLPTGNSFASLEGRMHSSVEAAVACTAAVNAVLGKLTQRREEGPNRNRAPKAALRDFL